MRAFIGIEFSDEQKKSIMNIQNIIRENSIKGRWKYIDNFHLTLKFLGEVSKMQIEAISDNMKKRMVTVTSFDIETGSIGYFDGDKCYRVIYLKLDDKNRNLEEIFDLTEECCLQSGIERERRRYTPHITIAQDVLLNNEYTYVKERTENIQKQIIHVDSISIFKSEQIGDKRVYAVQYSLKLKKS